MPVKISDLSAISSSLDLTTKLEVEDSLGASYYATLTQISSQLNIPNSTSELINDSGFITGITSIDVTNALGFSPQNANTAFSGDYTDLTNAPTVPNSLNDLSDVNAGTAVNGQVLKYNGTQWVPDTDLSGSGTVASVFGRTGSIIASSGDYSASKITNDSTAAGLNVAAVLDGFNTAISGKADSASLASVATSGVYADLTGTPTIPDNTNQLTNGAGYITALSEDGTPSLSAALDAAGNQISGFTNDIKDITGTTYTLLNTDTGRVLRTTNAAAVAITVPNTLPVGFVCEVIQKGAGAITFSGTATINNRQNHSATAGQFAVASLRSDIAGEVILAGDTA